MNVSDTVIMEGWLVRSREQGMRFPPFKSKWVRRYFVLRICDRNIGNFVLDEFRKDDKRRLRKSVDLTRCVQIDSYLQLADSSCSTTMRFGGFQWIFSIYFMKGNSEKKIQTYFVAESEDKMRDWVLNLCRACKLEKQNEEENSNQAVRDEGYLHHCELPVSSFAALSMSSGRSSESVFDTPRSDITSDDVRDSFAKSLPKNYLHMRNFRSNTTPRNIPSNSSIKEVENTNHRRTDSIDGPHASSSASACSSLASSHRSMTTEDDSSSSFSQMSALSSGPPIPPRTRLAPQFSSASSSTGITSRHPSRGAERLNQPIPPPAREIIGEIVDNESSGETIKLHGVPSHVPPLNSADTFFPHYVLLDSPVVSTVRIPSSPQDISAPPAVDRSKKPAKLRLDGDDDRVPSEMTIHGYNKYGSSFIRTPRTPQLPKTTPKPRYSVDPPKSAGPFGRSKELDYFEPLSVPLERAHSVRSPEPIDIEYIKIDADRTQAVKHSIAQRMTFD